MCHIRLTVQDPEGLMRFKAGLWQIIHQGGYQEIFYRIITTFPLPYPYETSYVPLALLTVAAIDVLIASFSGLGRTKMEPS